MGISSLDLNFPRFTDETTEEKVAQIQDYLFILLENLRYTLSNLDENNFNPISWSNITEPISAKIKDLEGNMTTLEITATGLVSRVSDAEGNINSIEQTLGGVAFKSSLQAGTTVINGGCIQTGTIEAERIGAGVLNLGKSGTRGRMTLYSSGSGDMWIESNPVSNALLIATALGGIELSCSEHLVLEGTNGINVSNYGYSLPTTLCEEGDLFFLLS